MKEKREFRCPHSFVRSQVRCVECDAAERSKLSVPTPETSKPVGRNYESKVTGRVYRCGECGETGHSKTTCAFRKRLASSLFVANPNLKFRPVPAEHAVTVAGSEKRSA